MGFFSRYTRQSGSDSIPSSPHITNRNTIEQKSSPVLKSKSSKLSLNSLASDADHFPIRQKSSSRLTQLVSNNRPSNSADSNDKIRQLNFGLSDEDSYPKQPRRKVSINELSHIRSHSVSSNGVATNIQEQPKMHHFVEQPQSVQQAQSVQPKKSLTFFNKIIKPVHSNRSASSFTSSQPTASERYVSNQSIEVVQTQLQYEDSDEENQDQSQKYDVSKDLELTTPVANVVRRRNPEQVSSINQAADSRLSTLTEDSFYFNSRVPLTPGYVSSEHGNRSSVLLRSDKRLNSPTEFRSSPSDSNSVTPNSDINRANSTKLLPPIGDEIHETTNNKISPPDEEDELYKKQGTPHTTKSNSTVASPASNTSRLSKIMSKISLTGIGSPKNNRNSMISMTNPRKQKLPRSAIDSLYNDHDFEPDRDIKDFLFVSEPTNPRSPSPQSSDSPEPVTTVDSNNLPTPTVGISNYGGFGETQHKSSSKSPNKTEESLAVPKSPESRSVFRSPSKRLSKRLSQRFGASPLLSLYKSSSSPKKSEVAPKKDNHEAINVPEFRVGGLEPKISNSNKSYGSSSIESAEIIEATSLVTAKKSNISPVKVDFGHHRNGSSDSSKLDKNTNFDDTLNTKEIKLVPLDVDFTENVDDNTPETTMVEGLNGTQLSPIEEVDSPDSAKNANFFKGKLSMNHREMPSINHSLNNFAEIANSISSSSTGADESSETQSNLESRPTTANYTKVDIVHNVSASEHSFHTTETSLPSPSEALFNHSVSNSASSTDSPEIHREVSDPFLIGISTISNADAIKNGDIEEKAVPMIAKVEPEQVNEVKVIPRKVRSPGKHIGSTLSAQQEDFLTRSAKTLSTVSVTTNKRMTLRPISAAFKTPLLSDYEDEVEQTPILPSNGKNNSQVTLNFDEKAESSSRPADIFESEIELPEKKTPIAATSEQPRKDVTRSIPPELQEVMQAESVDPNLAYNEAINYEQFIRSGESSPISEFEFATSKDYQKNKKLDFGLTSTPVETSKDPIFVNLKKNSPHEVPETIEIPQAPSQPKFPPPTPGFYHPTIAEESEESPQGSPKPIEEDPFIDSAPSSKPGSNGNIGSESLKLIRSRSMSRKSSQPSLSKLIYSNNIGSTTSDFDGNTVIINNSNSNRTLTNGLYTPTSSPFKTGGAITRRPSQLKRSNSLRFAQTPRGKSNPPSAKSPEISTHDDAASNFNDYSLKSPTSINSNGSVSRRRSRSMGGSPKHKPSLSNSTTESIYQEVYGNLRLRDEYKSDLSLNTMKKSTSLSSLDLKGRHTSRHLSHNLHIDSSIDLSFDNGEAANEFASLFVKAIHSFDAGTLASEDSAVCLSFEKDDIAFIYNFDESGWGEVVLLNDLSKGWVPMNFFKSAIDESIEPRKKEAGPLELAESKIYLKPLFIAAAEFLINPQGVPTADPEVFTFSSKHMDNIRDGVKLLLSYTDCISRTAPIVHKRPVIRKVRKALLADWYALMSKSEKYKGTTSETKIDFLKSLTYKVLIKALAFLDIWGNETESYEKQKEQERQEKKNRRRSRRKSRQEKVTYLDKVPFASERLLEVKELLLKYLALILGRLDIVEGNFVGCESLESIIHQIILLLRELLFIGKSATVLLNSKNYPLDSSLDNLLAYVSDLVTSVKHLVSKADIDEDDDIFGNIVIKDEEFSYTREGTKLVRIVSQMIISVSTATTNCQQLLSLTKDFQLNIYRKYPDFEVMKISPSTFIRNSVSEMIENQLLTYKITRNSELLDPGDSGCAFRFSHIRGGDLQKFTVTPDGARTLKEYISHPDADPRSTIIPCTNEEYDTQYSVDNILRDVVYDEAKNVIGASFKALVFLLANERTRASSFFIATFFMNFRNFGTTSALVRELIKRFDIGDREKEFLLRSHGLRITDVSAYDSRLKNRRRTILMVIQIWLESYWSYEKDFPVLSTLVNFLNEGASNYLPDEVFSIIELCATLTINHPSKKSIVAMHAESSQLISRRIGLSRKDSVVSDTSDAKLSASNSENDLSSLSSNSSMSSLASLNLPLNFSTYHISTIMNKNQGGSLEKSVNAFRNILADEWPTPRLSSAEPTIKTFQPLELNVMVDAWMKVCSKKLNISPPAVSTEFTTLSHVDIAKQLTSIESFIFLSIQPSELLDDNFRENRIHLKKCPNIERSVMFTNLLSEFVCDTILSPGLSVKSRVSNLKQWIKIATTCFQLRNYNSVAAITTSLQLSQISRLDKLWSGLGGKYLDGLDFLTKIINPDKNYKLYRNHLKQYLMTESKKCPESIVPYTNLFLQDLTFAGDGNRSKRIVTIDGKEKELINFDKYSKIVHTISELEYFQVPYSESDGASSGASGSKSSVFSFSPTITTAEPFGTLSANPSLQEFLLFKLWATKQYSDIEVDRFWKYSFEIQPQSNNN